MANIEEKIKNHLRDEGIKLWLPPYTNEMLEPQDLPQTLVTNVANTAGCSADLATELLTKIRLLSINRLVANKKFREQGIATVNVLQPGISQECDNVEISLDVPAGELRNLITSRLNLASNTYRLIASGRILEDDKIISAQGVTHNSDILIIVLSDNEIQANNEQTWRQSIDRTKEAATRLANKAEDAVSERYLQITDQNGQEIKLPQEERRALSTAIALHERGKSASKQKEYGRALLFFLEADEQFALVSRQILDLVDNYGILNLDIVWCYLMMDRVSALPDASVIAYVIYPPYNMDMPVLLGRRLSLAEQCFKKSYGPKYERLTVIRKGEGLEMCLIVRLQLLQGVVAYHQRNPIQARQWFGLAQEGILKMKVDDFKLANLIEMGYSEKESRLALRVTNGSVERAVAKIYEMREEQKEMKRKAKEEYRKRRLARHLGITNNGSRIDVDVYEHLIGMGFNGEATVAALRESNNEVNEAIEILRLGNNATNPTAATNPHLIPEELLDEMGQQLQSMGFDIEGAMSALRNHGSIQSAMDAMIRSSGANAPLVQAAAQQMRQHAASLGVNPDLPLQQPNNVEAAADEAAMEELAEVSTDPNEHLDATFDDEIKILNKYRAMISEV